MAHVGAEELAAGLEAIRGAPAEVGTVELIVRRPAVDQREVLEEGVLTTEGASPGTTGGGGAAAPRRMARRIRTAS